ncbi:VOC family protein [Vibrio diazotrophicus]|uniref:Catechol 2,3-dioxygenase-like lactoylglutathione lyase family enzyme n=1 Tax=Vibrio diazotrophicus TaxID=685 RepID=A0A329E6C5_VIBDI|nr:VOC family protein [Vibrio diazotrophicus]RAS61003.1 catechol 2,3-dioxygenase-like lactoylglutathione lyase family enzyme [Vibrio diazotrophicus]
MFSHIMVGSDDIEKSKAFYDAILGVLSYPQGVIDAKGRCWYFNSNGVLGLTKPINGEATTHGNGMTIGYKVDSPELVDAWHAAGVENGGVTCEEPPGVRVIDEKKLYLAYLRDPFGNKLCAAHYL